MKLEEEKTESKENKNKGNGAEYRSTKEFLIYLAKEYLPLITIAAALALIINTFVIMRAEVTSGSMEDTVMTGEIVMAFRLSYLFSDPERGDVIIFPNPKDPDDDPYVKRIIGLPGETVEIVDGIVYINGRRLNEYGLNYMILSDYGPYEVPEDSYFVLGDNRDSSYDSRKWPASKTYVSREDVLAKVFWVLPFKNINKAGYSFELE
ncbi:MAG: signal peptidase I [Lachnospiraceae bacterium]|nr:signal peptidase I [Lachnospiraceae bacterium]